MSSTKSTLDNEPYKSRIEELVREGEFNNTIAATLKEEFGLVTTDDSVRRFRKRHGLGIPTKENTSVKITGDDATVVTPVTQFVKGETPGPINRDHETVEGGQRPADQDPVIQAWSNVPNNLPNAAKDRYDAAVRKALQAEDQKVGETVGVTPRTEATKVQPEQLSGHTIGEVYTPLPSEVLPSEGHLLEWTEETPISPEEKLVGWVTNQDAPVETNLKDRLNDPDAMLRERGLDPQDWTIEGITVNEWEGIDGEGTKVLNHQAKLQLKRKKPEITLLPARSSGWQPPVKSPNYWTRDFAVSQKSIVLVGDQQAPFHDQNLHRLFLEWLEHNKPDEGVLIGDTVDFPDVSRHRANPENLVTANECIQAGYEILRDYVSSSTDTTWTKLIGNHDERIRNFVIDNARPLYGIARATRDAVEKEERVLDVEYLLRLDELGIKLVDPKGGYAQAQVNLEDVLAVRHGWLTRKGSGATAHASMEAVGFNIVVGHTHRQSLVQKTTHTINGQPETIFGVESGCMCSVDGVEVNGRRFPDYTTNPDWQQGFAVATIYGDGTTNIELAHYKNGSLFYRDQRYS